MTPSILASAIVLALSGAALADGQATSSTGRILMAEPRPGDVADSTDNQRHQDPWPYQGDWLKLQLRATMLSSTGGMAVVEDPQGGVHSVHVDTLLADIQARVVSIGAGRLEMIWETGSPVLDQAWCLLVIELETVLTEADGDAPQRQRVVTRHRKAACGPTPELTDPDAG